MIEPRLNCWDFVQTAALCCTSCHEDSDAGYDLAEYDPPDPPEHKGRRKISNWIKRPVRPFGSVCCGLVNAPAFKFRVAWAVALRNWRKSK